MFMILPIGDYARSKSTIMTPGGITSLSIVINSIYSPNNFKCLQSRKWYTLSFLLNIYECMWPLDCNGFYKLVALLL
jgi:hypothetical protein